VRLRSFPNFKEKMMTDVKKQKDIFTGANLSNKSEIVKVKGYKTFTV